LIDMISALKERDVKLRIGHNVQFLNDTGHTPSDLKHHSPDNVQNHLIDIWNLLDPKFSSIIHSKMMIFDR